MANQFGLWSPTTCACDTTQPADNVAFAPKAPAAKPDVAVATPTVSSGSGFDPTLARTIVTTDRTSSLRPTHRPCCALTRAIRTSWISTCGCGDLDVQVRWNVLIQNRVEVMT
jgi:hypothetical protein